MARWFAEVVDKRYPIKGMPVFMPYGFFMHTAIMEIIERERERGLCRLVVLFPFVLLLLSCSNALPQPYDLFYVNNSES